MTTPRPYTFDRVTRIIFTVIAVIGAFYVLNILKGALLPFVVAWLFAYLLNPIVLFFQNRLRIKSRIVAIISTLLCIVFVVSVVCMTVVPSIVAEFHKSTEIVKDISQSANMNPITEKVWYQSLLDELNIESISKLLNVDEWSALLESSLSNVWKLLTGSLNQILSIIGSLIVLLYLIFILLDYDKIIAGFKALIPQQYREITLSILVDVEQGMSRYFRGQSLVALIVGILFSIGFVIIGLPLAIPLGIFIGVLNLVPYLQIVGILPTVLLCVLGSYDSSQSFWTLLGLSAVVFAVVQSIQDLLLVPRIMGKVTGLNPAVILLSLSIWGTLLGVMGMIIALPLTSLSLAYYQKYILDRTTLPPDKAQGGSLCKEIENPSEEK